MSDPQPLAWLSELISRHGIAVALPAVFVGGLALNLTPCVYPMLPVTLAFFTSQASGAVSRAAGLAACYVLGISLNYALLGWLAAQTGLLFGSWLQQPAVLIAIAAVIAALSLGMFGLYEFRAPAVLTRSLGRASAGLWGAFFMGLVVGLVAAPCIGPFVLGLLLLVSGLANPAAGFLLFFVLGLGMGLPYLLLGIAAHRVKQLPKAGEWLLWVKHALGILLLGLALYFIRPLLPARAVGWLTAALLAGAGAHLGWLARARSRGPAFRAIRLVVGSALIAVAAVVVWPRPPAASPVAWRAYTEAALEEAQRAGRPAVVDVYADWCAPCVEMDHVTFRHPDVVRALLDVETLRVDATLGVSEDAEQLLRRYRVLGAPTVLFFDRGGRERTDLRLLGFETPEEFLQRLQRIR
jgi:thiol:disulfide interchange protein DsbD